MTLTRQDLPMLTVQTRGARLCYQVEGIERSGSPVLLIQGVGVIGEGWRPQLDGLKDRYRLATFDNRGIGGSVIEAGAAGAALSIEAMAEDALAVMDAAGFAQAHVVGHSMGGVIAQQLALSAPSRVKSLSFLCTFHVGREAVRMTPTILQLGLRSRIGTRKMRRNAFLQLVMPPASLRAADRDRLAADLAKLFGHDLADQPPIAMPQLRAMSRYDASARLAQLAGVPTLVLSAEHDVIARPAYGRALAAAIPGARYVEFPGAGHGVPIEHAQKINQHLAEHFSAAATA